MPLPLRRRPPSLPEGYVRVGGAGARGFAWAGCAPWAEGLLASGEALHGWAGARPERRRHEGRGTAWAVAAPSAGPDGATAWVVRRYRRGGAVAPVLGDRYLAVGEPRPLAELRASVEAARRGIPTPRVVAGAVYPAGLFYRADLVTEEIPGGRDLASVLFGGASAPDADAALAAAGALVGRLEAAGVRHADLNARNIVLTAGDAGFLAWLVDLDRCGFGRAGRAGAGGAMRRRLERSLRKLGAGAPKPPGPETWAALRAGYGSRGGAP